MRPLTPAERRYVEQLKKDLPLSSGAAILVNMTPAQYEDMWNNIFAIVLETDNVLREQWRKSYGSVGNVVE